MKGDFLGRGAEIVLESTGQPVAQIDRHFTKRDVWGGQTYILTVPPGVDMVLMCALCICLDEMREKN